MAGSKEIEREVLDGKGMSAEEFARLKRKREQMRIKSRQLENLTNFFDFETDDLMLVGEIEEVSIIALEVDISYNAADKHLHRKSSIRRRRPNRKKRKRHTFDG